MNKKAEQLESFTGDFITLVVRTHPGAKQAIQTLLDHGCNLKRLEELLLTTCAIAAQMTVEKLRSERIGKRESSRDRVFRLAVGLNERDLSSLPARIRTLADEIRRFSESPVGGAMIQQLKIELVQTDLDEITQYLLPDITRVMIVNTPASLDVYAYLVDEALAQSKHEFRSAKSRNVLFMLVFFVFEYVKIRTKGRSQLREVSILLRAGYRALVSISVPKGQHVPKCLLEPPRMFGHKSLEKISQTKRRRALKPLLEMYLRDIGAELREFDPAKY